MTLDETAREQFASGYRHHSYGIEKATMRAFLEGKTSGLFKDLNLDTYIDMLAPQPLRSMKNGLISFLTIYCRLAIDLGLNAEKSFAVSDQFMNKIELTADRQQMDALLHEIMTTYKQLVLREEYRDYSLHVVRAIRFIAAKLYGPLTVQDVAEEVGINAHYLARLFAVELGCSPAQYIRNKKMAEAKELLRQSTYSVGEIASILGYCNAAYFIKVFRQTAGQTPHRFKQMAHQES
ncbi:helix-turn-helix domain-containing protein [Lacticaseibacillus daqingensis]|uniref:helix-turn-helix domain-containing protein n=1 Tax=Lacticaseibacillus daqingensis TaxID=2486014 RepID=UPI001CDB99ED|nr:AraC family transcriptional regulator [Lacticaseibacillus daqingensis]